MLWVKQYKGVMQECKGSDQQQGHQWPHGWREGVVSKQEGTESARNNQGNFLEGVNFPFYLWRGVKERLDFY